MYFLNILLWLAGTARKSNFQEHFKNRSKAVRFVVKKAQTIKLCEKNKGRKVKLNSFFKRMSLVPGATLVLQMMSTINDLFRKSENESYQRPS